jgi:hypothetical protein
MSLGPILLLLDLLLNSTILEITEENSVDGEPD